MVCGRTAPSTSGHPHPGTALSALLAWLEARSRGGRFFVRLEDLDVGRSRPAYVASLRQFCDWLGLDYDHVELQSDNQARHAQALDALAQRQLLYACRCSRRRLAALPAATGELGTAAYDSHCRSTAPPLTPAGWRTTPHAVRVRLDGAADPILRRRDGIVAYALASVVDDAAAGVTDVVRGRDLAVHAPVHAALYRLLGLRAPRFVHHPLLVCHRGASGVVDKLAKMHGDTPVGPGLTFWSAERLLGQLAFLLGLRGEVAPTSAGELLRSWQPGALAGLPESLFWGKTCGRGTE